MSAGARMVLDARNIVGESIVWDEQRQRLLWVDIIAKRVHVFSPESGEHQSWQMPTIATSIGLRRDGGAIVGLQKTIALWDYGDDVSTLCEIESDLPGNRLNEGVVGPDGAFWVGTMQNNINPDGSPSDITEDSGRLYRVDADGSVARLSDDTFGITNTLVWTDDGRLITADTTKNALYSYACDADAARLSNRTIFLKDHPRGLPDGSTKDEEGLIWNCRVVGGSSLIRITSDGEIRQTVELPCSWPTSCTFGGPDFDTLYVTSARFTMDESHLEANPHEGGLFAVDVGIKGRPENRFG